MSSHFNTKDRILDAAEELFAQHGFAGTSLRQVTSRADVNIAAVNYHFGSKENLVNEVFKHRMDEMSESGWPAWRWPLKRIRPIWKPSCSLSYSRPWL